MSQDIPMKMLLVGDLAAGKSSLLLRFSDGNFNTSLTSTIGVDFRIRSLQIQDKICKLQIWDTAGQERFGALTSSYYKGATAIIVTCDLCNEASVSNLPRWFDKIEQNASPNVALVIACAKSDLIFDPRHLEKAREIAEMRGRIPVIQCSAKTDSNVDELFTAAATRVLEQMAGGAAKSSLPAEAADGAPKRIGGWKKK